MDPFPPATGQFFLQEAYKLHRLSLVEEEPVL